MKYEDDEASWPIGSATMRVDSFEVIRLEIELTEEEKTWPVGRATMRVDSFEVIDLEHFQFLPGEYPECWK